MTDIVIIGAGPAGQSAALLLGRMGRKTILIDDNSPRNSASSGLHGLFTRDGENPMSLRQIGRDQLSHYPCVQWTWGHVFNITEEKSQVSVNFKTMSEPADSPHDAASKVRTICSRAVLLASGSTDLLPDIAGFSEIWGTSGHHCPYCDGYEHRNKSMVAYGKGKRGSGLALEMLLLSPDITLCTDGGDLEEVPLAHRQKMAEHGIRIMNNRLARLHSKEGHLQEIEFFDGTRLAAQVFFFNTGRTQRLDTGMIKLANGKAIARNEKGMLSLQSDNRIEHSERIFACGNCSAEAIDMAVMAAANGALAAVNLNRQLLREDLQLEEV